MYLFILSMGFLEIVFSKVHKKRLSWAKTLTVIGVIKYFIFKEI